MKHLRYVGLILLIGLIGLIGCNNSSSKSSSIKENVKKKDVQTENNSISLPVKQEVENEKELDDIILNSELSSKFDSVKTIYVNYFQKESIFDTLMVFQKNDCDTLIQKSKVDYLYSFDPHAAYYLYNSDTIIGGEEFCDLNFYLLKDGELSKVISQFADCVESGSYTRKEICLDSTGITLFYLKDVDDVWDDNYFKKGFVGFETEIYALFDLKQFKFGVKKQIIQCRPDLNLPDTVKFEVVELDDFGYLLPEIKFGFEN